MRRFVKCGIHTRLRYIIAKSGGYSISLGANQLMKDYGIEDKSVALYLAKYSGIRGQIEREGLDTIIDIAKQNIIVEERKYARAKEMWQGVMEYLI